MSKALNQKQRDTPRLERVLLIAAMVAWGFSFHFYDFNYPQNNGQQPKGRSEARHAVLLQRAAVDPGKP